MKPKIFESEAKLEFERSDNAFGGNTFALIGALALSFKGMMSMGAMNSSFGDQVAVNSAFGILAGTSAYHYYKAARAAFGVVAAHQDVPDLEDILPVTLVLTDEQYALVNLQPKEYPPLMLVPPLEGQAA